MESTNDGTLVLSWNEEAVNIKDCCLLTEEIQLILLHCCKNLKNCE